MYYLEIREASSLLRTRDVSPVELTRLMLDRIAAFDNELHAYSYVMADESFAAAEQAAREIARGHWRGPLHGIPVAVKDLCWTAGNPTAGGTRVLQDFIPARDATVVARLREAGAVIIGKTRMSEAAFSDHHPALPTPLNPWDAATWIGASSSGAAAATAAGLCYGSLASDTGGSIRFPSTAAGLTGLKPTWGRVSGYGVLEFAGSLDCIGPMARSAWDCALILGAIAGPDVDDPTALLEPVPDYPVDASRELGPLRVGLDREFMVGFDSVTQAAIERAAGVYQSIGATVEDVSIPDVSDVVNDWTGLCAVEAALAHEGTFPSRREAYGPQVQNLLDMGWATTAVDFHRMLVRRRMFAGRFQRLFQEVDVLLLPTIGIASPTVEQMKSIGIGPQWHELIMKATCPINIAGNPALTMPCGLTERQTPIGYQLVGSRLSEALLLRAGRAFQEATDHHKRHPDGYAWGITT